MAKKSNFYDIAALGKVYIDGVHQSAMQVLFVEASHASNDRTSGFRVDHARIVYDLGRYSLDRNDTRIIFNSPEAIHIQNHAILNTDKNEGDGPAPYIGKTCEISITHPDFSERFVHAGELNLEEIEIEGDDEGGTGGSEKICFVSRHTQHLFGRPLTFQRTIDPTASSSNTDEVYLEDEIVFNPEINFDRRPHDSHTDGIGMCIGNMLAPKGSDPTKNEFPKFIPLGAVMSDEAKKVWNQEPDADKAFWTLSDAVMYVLSEGNGKQEFFTNPSRYEINHQLGEIGKAKLRHFHLRSGFHVNEALGDLLEPFGMRARIEYSGLGVSNRKIYFYPVGSLGVGNSTKKLYLQAADETLVRGKSSAKVLSINADMSQLVNEVRVTGSFTKVEGTFYLMPAWDPYDQASLMATDEAEFLTKDSEEWKNHPEWHRVFRCYALNEGGDYGGPAEDLNPLFQSVDPNHPKVLPRRRRFFPMLSVDQPDIGRPGPYGNVGGCWVQFYNHDNVAIRHPPWKDLWLGENGWSCELMEDECGIVFVDDTPPGWLTDWVIETGAGSSNALPKLYVRITACIESDTRINYLAARRDSSIAKKKQIMHIHKPHSFHFAKRSEGGKFQSLAYSDLGLRVVDRDDTPHIKDLAEKVREAFDAGSAVGTVTVEGLFPVDPNGSPLNYAVGDVIEKVVGREIDLATNKGEGSPGEKGPEPRYANVTGVLWKFQGVQETVLTLETFLLAESHAMSLLSVPE